MIINTDIAVIGAGSAGLAAAIEAKKSGVKRVTLIERDSYMGGLLGQCIHNGFGLQYFDKDLSGPEYADRFIKMLDDYDIEIMMETMVLDLDGENKVIKAVNSEKGTMTIQAGAIILAMGCRERPRGSLNIFGSRPAGIFTAGAAQRTINIDGYLPGKKVVILGSGDIGMIMARRLTLAGVKIEAVVEVLPYIGGLVRNECQCLRDFDIPVYLQHTVSAIHGNEHITGVTLSKVDERIQPIAGTEIELECDTLLLSVGLIPENELSRDAGIEISDVGGPVVDENMQTSISGVFAAGNVVHVHDLVDYITQSAQIAGRAAAQYIANELPEKAWKIRVEKGENIRYVVPQHLNAVEGEGATLYMRVTKPVEQATMQLSGDVLTKKFTKIKPSEMIKLELTAEQVAKVKDGLIRVDFLIEKEEADVADVPTNGGIEIICTTCPMACRGYVFLDANGNPERTIGYRCKRGDEFARKEVINPERILTGTLLTAEHSQPLLPIRSDNLIPKSMIMDCMKEMAAMVISEPVQIGDIVVENILGTGANIVACSDYPLQMAKQ